MKEEEEEAESSKGIQIITSHNKVFPHWLHFTIFIFPDSSPPSHFHSLDADHLLLVSITS